MKLIDTSVAVDHLRGYGPATALLDSFIRSRESIAASELTRFELLAGAQPGEQDQLEGLFSVIDWVPVTEDVVRRAGTYVHSYRRGRSGIGVVVDYLIAGTASVVGANLVTTNVRHFPMFDDLRPPYRYGTEARS